MCNSSMLGEFWTIHATSHCKDKMPKIWNKYSQKRNIAASVPISSFMCLWANYIFPRWGCLFCWRKYVGRLILGIYKSLKDTWMWKLGWCRAIPRKGIYNGIAVAVRAARTCYSSTLHIPSLPFVAAFLPPSPSKNTFATLASFYSNNLVWQSL